MNSLYMNYMISYYLGMMIPGVIIGFIPMVIAFVKGRKTAGILILLVCAVSPVILAPVFSILIAVISVIVLLLLKRKTYEKVEDSGVEEFVDENNANGYQENGGQVCSGCGNIIPEEYAACPYCGRFAINEQKNKRKTWIVLVLLVSICLILIIILITYLISVSSPQKGDIAEEPWEAPYEDDVDLDFEFEVDSIPDLNIPQIADDSESYAEENVDVGEAKKYSFLDGKMLMYLSEEQYDVFTQDNTDNQLSLERQGIAQEKMDEYMQISGYALKAVPVGEDFIDPEFVITLNVKDKDYEGIPNLKNFPQEEKELMGSTMILGWPGTDSYEWYSTETADYIVFDTQLSGYERRYATIFDGRMIYIFLTDFEGPLDFEEKEILREIVDNIVFFE